jgi:hypothetical protein
MVISSNEYRCRRDLKHIERLRLNCRATARCDHQPPHDHTTAPGVAARVGSSLAIRSVPTRLESTASASNQRRRSITLFPARLEAATTRATYKRCAFVVTVARQCCSMVDAAEL